MFLNIADRSRAGFSINVKDDKPQGQLQRRRIGHATLLAFLNVIFGLFENKFHKLKRSIFSKILDRKDRLKDGLKPEAGTLYGRYVNLQKPVIRCLLNLDQVGHRRDLFDTAETFTDSLALGERLGGHQYLLTASSNGT